MKHKLGSRVSAQRAASSDAGSFAEQALGEIATSLAPATGQSNDEDNSPLRYLHRHHDRHRDSQRCRWARPRWSFYPYVHLPPIRREAYQSKKTGRLTHHPPAATREEMSAAKLPLQYRDSCAHLLIPLNKCRVESYYLPWKCEVCTTSKPDASRNRRADKMGRTRDIRTKSANTRSSSCG